MSACDIALHHKRRAKVSGRAALKKVGRLTLALRAGVERENRSLPRAALGKYDVLRLRRSGWWRRRDKRQERAKTAVRSVLDSAHKREENSKVLQYMIAIGEDLLDGAQLGPDKSGRVHLLILSTESSGTTVPGVLP